MNCLHDQVDWKVGGDLIVYPTSHQRYFVRQGLCNGCKTMVSCNFELRKRTLRHDLIGPTECNNDKCKHPKGITWNQICATYNQSLSIKGICYDCNGSYQAEFVYAKGGRISDNKERERLGLKPISNWKPVWVLPRSDRS